MRLITYAQYVLSLFASSLLLLLICSFASPRGVRIQGTLSLREGRGGKAVLMSNEVPQNLFMSKQRYLLFPDGSKCLLDNLGLETKAKSISWMIVSMAKSRWIKLSGTCTRQHSWVPQPLVHPQQGPWSTDRVVIINTTHTRSLRGSLWFH